MYLILVIGATGQGKSPFVKKYLEGKNCLVFDIQNEYGERAKQGSNGIILNLPTDNTKARSRYIGNNRDEFIDLCKKKQNTICVFEDATIFFQGATGENMRDLIFSKAHSNNNYILVFHAINRVPPAFMEGADYVVLFRTRDEIRKVAVKYNSLLKPFIKLRENPKLQPLKIKMI
jgi:hypothetical protein